MEKSFIKLIEQTLLLPDTELAMDAYKRALNFNSKFNSPETCEDEKSIDKYESDVDKLELFLSHYILLKILKESPLNIISTDTNQDAKNILNIILHNEELDDLKCDLIF